MAAEWGDLSGTFTYSAPAPKRDRLKVEKDLECCGKYLDEIVDESVTVGEKGGLANVFIYLKPGMGKKIDVHPDLLKAAETPVVLDNIHCVFKPHAVAVWAGKQSLRFTNSDPIGHAAKIDFFKNPSVNALVPVGSKMDMKFQFAESVPAPVSCGVHPWEVAYLFPHDNPYVAISNIEGKFKISKIPVGEWEFVVWQEKVGFLKAKPDWARGRFKFKVKAGENDLGEIKVTPDLLVKKK
jgi:plastocyanin